MTEQEKDEFRRAGWSEEEIESAEHINEQMSDFFGVINAEAKEKEK